MSTCRYEGCERKPAYEGQPFCEDHRLRWVPGQPVNVPAWIQRKNERGLPAKDYSRNDAA